MTSAINYNYRIKKFVHRVIELPSMIEKNMLKQAKKISGLGQANSSLAGGPRRENKGNIEWLAVNSLHPPAISPVCTFLYIYIRKTQHRPTGSPAEEILWSHLRLPSTTSARHSPAWRSLDWGLKSKTSRRGYFVLIQTYKVFNYNSVIASLCGPFQACCLKGNLSV